MSVGVAVTPDLISPRLFGAWPARRASASLTYMGGTRVKSSSRMSQSSSSAPISNTHPMNRDPFLAGKVRVSPLNTCMLAKQATPGVEGSVFDKSGREPMAFWTFRQDAASLEHV